MEARSSAPGFPIGAKNLRGWTAFYESLSLGDRDALRVLHSHQLERMYLDFEERKPLLLAALRSVENFEVQVK